MAEDFALVQLPNAPLLVAGEHLGYPELLEPLDVLAAIAVWAVGYACLVIARRMMPSGPSGRGHDHRRRCVAVAKAKSALSTGFEDRFDDNTAAFQAVYEQRVVADGEDIEDWGFRARRARGRWIAAALRGIAPPAASAAHPARP